MNNADCAMMPGARNARYGTSPVSITRRRENVCPKISSHSTGCTMRVNSSVRSCRSFCNSTSAKAPTLNTIPRTRCHPWGARTSSTPAFGSTDTTRRPSCGADRPEAVLRGVLAEIRARIVTEDVLKRGLFSDCLLQLRRRADRLQSTVMHQRDPVTQRVGLLHVVRGEQHGHSEVLLHPPDLRPDTVSCNGIQPDGRFVEDQ